MEREPVSSMKGHQMILRDSIMAAVKEAVSGRREIGIMFSGGLDSCLLAFLSKEIQKDTAINLYTVGTRNSHDIKSADSASEILGMNLVKIEISREEILEAVPKVSRIIESESPVRISYELPLYIGLLKVKEKHVMTGQGADELFGGYSRYLRMSPDPLKTAMEKDINNLLSRDFVMERKMASFLDKDLLAPYLETHVVKAALEIPCEHKVRKGERKVILKKVAYDVGLPRELVEREKKASQYGSGIARELRREAKMRKMAQNHLISGLILKTPQ